MSSYYSTSRSYISYLYNNGGSGNDVLYGTSGDNTLFGNDGDDVLHGFDGNDKLYGGFGNDLLYGGNGTDTLVGDWGADALFGDVGTDFLYGGEGNDLLRGGIGQDYLSGDGGSDWFVFRSGESFAQTGNADVILGWDATDRIEGARGNFTTIRGNGYNSIEEAQYYANLYQANGWMPTDVGNLYIESAETGVGYLLMDLDNDANNTFESGVVIYGCSLLEGEISHANFL